MTDLGAASAPPSPALPPPALPPPHLAVIWLAWPVLVEQLLIFCVGLFDTFLAGRISTNATIAIGMAAYAGWLPQLMFTLVGTATTALVARNWGTGNFQEGNRFFNQSLPLAAAIGVAAGVVMSAAAPGLASLQQMTGETHDIVVRFLRFDALSYGFVSMSLVSAAALRGTGDMRTPMVVLGVVNVLNIIASTSLVYGLGPLRPLGVDGIVAGTVLARMCGALLMLGLLIRGWNHLQIRLSLLKFSTEAMQRLLRIGIPNGIDGLLTWLGHFLFVMVIAQIGTGETQRATFAAHMIGIQVEALTYLPAIAWGTASATLIGQSLGAGERRRAVRIGHIAVLQCALLALLAAMIYYVFAAEIFAWMHRDAQVREIGIPALRFLAFFQIPLVVLIVYIQSLRGAGDTSSPMFFALVSVLFVRVPVAYLCAIVLEGGLIGAWIGMATDITLRAIMATVRFSRGKWVTLQV